MGKVAIFNLTERQKKGILAYLKVLQTRYRNKILRVVLFGSVARGKADAESDVDILVVLKNGSNKLRDEISMASFDSILRYEVIISPLVMDSKTYKWHKRYKDPLYNSIERDGVDLWIKRPESLLKSA